MIRIKDHPDERHPKTDPGCGTREDRSATGAAKQIEFRSGESELALPEAALGALQGLQRTDAAAETEQRGEDVRAHRVAGADQQRQQRHTEADTGDRVALLGEVGGRVAGVLRATCDRHGARGHGRHPVGELASAVLAVAGALRDGVDGRKPFRTRANGGVRHGPPDGSDGVLDSAATDHSLAGPELAPAQGGRRRLEGQSLAPALRNRDSRRPGGILLRRSDLRVGRGHVARAGQAYRARDARLTDSTDITLVRATCSPRSPVTPICKLAGFGERRAVGSIQTIRLPRP